jgi:hypothetical protein
MKSKLIYFSALLSFTFFVFVSPTKAQDEKDKTVSAKQSESQCAVEGFSFDCPDDFVINDKIEKKSIIFESNSGSLLTYLFISTSPKFTDKNKIGRKIAENFGSFDVKNLKWKNLDRPFFMTLNSKYKKGETNYFGFDGVNLLNFIVRQFSFQGKDIYVGYAYKIAENDTKERFENQLGGENAVGCTAVASWRNLVTKEKKEKKQYCTLSIKIASLQNREK